MMVRMAGSQAHSAFRGVHRLTVTVVVVALLLTAGLVVLTRTVRDRNENRLLDQRAHEVTAVTGSSIQGLRAPLADAATLAEVTGGSASTFTGLMTPITAVGFPFASASLWRVGDSTPLAVSGRTPALAGRPAAERRAFLARAATRREISVYSMLDAPDRRVGYAFGDGGEFVVYAEATLPKDRKARIAKDSAFADLDYALYLGRHEVPGRLIASSSGKGIPAGGRKASGLVPLGDSSVLVVISPRSNLGGTVLAWLPWILLGFGLVVTVVAGCLTEFLVRRREHAELLAARLETSAELNRALYREQRAVAVTLQRSLMPRVLPSVPGLEIAGRYEAGVAGTEVGGDWYDVLPVAPKCLLFSVGDVSGRGLEAAATMASLRYAIRAYALDGAGPDEVLHKLTTVLSIGTAGLFATVICGMIDSEAGTLTVARAGHPDLLMLSDDGSRFLDVPVGPAIGIVEGCEYTSRTVDLTPVTTFLAFTDGLIERRNETIDAGMERLRAASHGRASHDRASHDRASVDELVTDLVATLAAGSADDVAVLALRWTGTVDDDARARTEERVP
jgi:serine phosphatase RsbU (regulator of sigma subunit)